MVDARWNELNAERWGEDAARWRAFGLPAPEDVRRLLVDLACPPEALLLDVGCGAGLWSVALGRAGYRVHGFDISPRMIDEARRLADEYGIGGDVGEFEVGDAERISLANASVDGVICRNVLDFVSSPGAALGEIWRVLKPGCRLVLSVLGANSPVKREAWRRFLPGAAAPTGMNYMLPWEMEALLGELGWEILGHRADFGPAASGATNEYTAEMTGRWEDRIVQQTLTTVWEFVIAKPAVADEFNHPAPSPAPYSEPGS